MFLEKKKKLIKMFKTFLATQNMAATPHYSQQSAFRIKT
jgi:hypothetical protein